MTFIYAVFGLSMLFYIHGGYIQHKLFKYKEDKDFIKSIYNYLYLLFAPFILLMVALFVQAGQINEDAIYFLFLYFILSPIIMAGNGIYLYLIHYVNKSLEDIKAMKKET